jgi:hypothetical protein
MGARDAMARPLSPASLRVRSDSERIDKLEKRMEEFGPKILRTIEERFGDRRPRTPEPRSKADHSAAPWAAQITPPLPQEEQGGEEWRVVELRRRKRAD